MVTLFGDSVGGRFGAAFFSFHLLLAYLIGYISSRGVRDRLHHFSLPRSGHLRLVVGLRFAAVEDR